MEMYPTKPSTALLADQIQNTIHSFDRLGQVKSTSRGVCTCLSIITTAPRNIRCDGCMSVCAILGV